MNVQHVESLNDVVAQHHAHPRARDGARLACSNAADEIELVDLTPDGPARPAARGQGLRPRAGPARARALLPQGQPDRPARARAPPHRRARRRPDARATCASMPSPARGAAGERVMVAVDPSPAAANAGARRQAHGRRARCRADCALCRDRPSYRAVGDRAARLAEAMRLAERLGAEMVHSAGRSVVEESWPLPVRAMPRASWWASLTARAGSNCVMVRWSTSWCAAALGSRWKWRRADRQKARPLRPDWLFNVPRAVARIWKGVLTTAVATAAGGDRRLYRSCPTSRWFSSCRSGRGRPPRVGAVAVGLGTVGARLQLLLPAAALRIHHPRSGERRGAVLLHGRRGCGQRSRRPHAGADRIGTPRGADDGRALCLQPQDRGRDRSRRPFVDHGDSSGAADERGDRHPDAGEGQSETGSLVLAPLFRPTATSPTPTSPRRAGRGTPTIRPGAAPTPCRAGAGCSCRSAPARTRSA